MKTIYLSIIASLTFSCSQAEFHGTAAPGVIAPKDDVLDVSDMKDKNPDQIRNEAKEAPEVVWDRQDQVPGNGPLSPLPGGNPWTPSLPTTHPEHRSGNPNMPTIPVEPGKDWPTTHKSSTPPGSPNSPNSPINGTVPTTTSVDPSNPGTGNKTGSTPGGPEIRPIQRVLKVLNNCQENTDEQFHYIDVEGPRTDRIEARLQGEFCPNSSHTINVLFVVDFSASMGRHQPESGGPVQDGNDPLLNGTCGRMSAVSAIIEQLRNSKPGIEIRLALIPFASNVVRPYSLPVMNMDQFQTRATPEALCRYVLQSEEYRTPGALTQGESGTGPSTNYAAAFSDSMRSLATAQGRNVVYFITDGEPTAPRPDPAGAGIQMAEQLRRTIPNLTFNSIILGSQRPEAERVLTAVTGAAERVRYAAAASELASTITEFADAKIDPNHPANTGWVFVDPYPAQKLGLESFVQNSQDLYTYITKPFVLLGIPGQTISNRVVIEAHGFDGSTHRSIVIVRYRQN